MKKSHAHPDAVADPVAARLATLSEPFRLRMCRILERQELNVGEVACVFQSPQSTVSRHLKQLTEANWVQRRAEGTSTLYRLSPDDLDQPARAIWAAVREHAASPERLAEDDRRLLAVLAERQLDSKAYFGKVAGAWDDIRQDLFGQGFTAPALLALLDPEAVIADLGCGTGNAAAALAPFVSKIIAVDQSAPMLVAAKQRLHEQRNVIFRTGTLDAVPIDDASVDAAVAVLVLHHVPNIDAALAEMRRILKPGGRVLVIDMLPHQRSEFRHHMGHCHLGFSDETMTDALFSAGFERPRCTPLPPRSDAKGPSLFVATARAGPAAPESPAHSQPGPG